MSNDALVSPAGRTGLRIRPRPRHRQIGWQRKIITITLDHNREVVPTYLVETKDGESVLGIIGNESATSVALKQPNGVEATVLRSNISRMQSQRQSAMPEGLEAGLSQQDVADLVEF